MLKNNKEKRTLQEIKSPHKIKVKSTLVQKKKYLGRAVLNKIRRNKQGKFSDRDNLSNEKYEQDYVRRVAKNWTEKLSQYDSNQKIEIKVSQLRRLVEFIRKY